MTKIISFLGGPGTGKSVAAANAYAQLKARGFSCELTREFATDLVWNERVGDLKDQNYIFAEQNYRQQKLMGKVDFIITDTSLLLSIIYRRLYRNSYLADTCFEKLVFEVFNKYDNISFIIKRTNSSFGSEGRIHNMEEALVIDKMIYDLFREHRIPFLEIDRDNFFAELDLAISGQLSLL